MVTSSLDDLIDNMEMWLDSRVYQTSPYRMSLFTPVFYAGKHKETEKGVVVTVHQFRKDFYKPKDWKKDETGFFLMNQIISRRNIENFVNSVPEDQRKFAQNLATLINDGFIVNKWSIKEVKTRAYLSLSNYYFIENELKKEPYFVLDGTHIRTLKHQTPQFEGHKPFESDAGTFYYSTELCLGEIKQDYDYRFDTISDIHESEIEVIEEEDHNIASVLVEVESF